MTTLTPEILDAWKRHVNPVVVTTVSDGGTVNSIYASSVSLYNGNTIIVADNYFDKTRRNILANGKGAILFITNDKKAYQLKGRFAYHKSGPVYDDMKQWNSPERPGHAAIALEVEEAYKGSERLI